MIISPIHNEQDYRETLARIEALMDAPVGAPAEDELDALATLVEDYERKEYPMAEPDPVEALKFYLEQNIPASNNDAYQALIAYDPELGMFTGEFLDLEGKADLYGKDIKALKKEGYISLRVLLKMRREEEAAAKQPGEFALRMPQDLYQQACASAAANGQSFNSFIVEAVRKAIAQ